MSFRPVRKVREPDGREWELYLSRGALPAWREGGFNSWVDEPIGFHPAIMIPMMLVGFLWSSLISPALRFLFLLPVALVKGRRSFAMRIEAVSYRDMQETRLWTTTRDMADSVLNQIALGLEEGKVVHPVGAVYSGSRVDT